MTVFVFGSQFHRTDDHPADTVDHFGGRSTLDTCQQDSHRNRFAFLDDDLAQHTSCRRGNFQRHLFSFHFQEGLVLFDQSTDRGKPFHDCSFSDAFSELGHEDVGGHAASSDVNREA